MKPRPPKDYPLLPGFDLSPEAQPQAEVIEPAADPQPQRKPAGRKVVLIHHQQNGVLIDQRPTDGYVNATSMCQAFGKLFADYARLDTTEARLNHLGLIMGIPIINLVESRAGRYGGTWVHPRVALDLAAWLSAPFAIEVNGWVFKWLQEGPPAASDDCFEVRRLLERLAEGMDNLGEGIATVNSRLSQMQPMVSETWQAEIHSAYATSARADQVTPPPWTGKRQLTGPTPPPTGRPKLVEPRRGFAPNPNFRKGYS